MAVASCASIEISKHVPQLLSPRSGKWDNCRLTVHSWKSLYIGGSICKKYNIRITKCAKLDSNSMAATNGESKTVWIWTENKQVMTAAVERGWNTFIFPSHCGELAKDWACELLVTRTIAFINPLFVKEQELIDIENKRVATFFEISSPEQLDQLLLIDDMLENVIVDLLDWQVIPAENMVAAFQGSMKKLFAIAKNPEEAQISLEALEHGLDGVVLKVEDVAAVLKLKDYFDRRNELRNCLTLIKATVTQVRVAGMGDRVCVDLCSLMRPGEGLLVGSFARGLFLVHSECLESNYVASRPFRVNAGPVHSYVAVPGDKTCYLSELCTGKEVTVVDQDGQQRTAVIGRVKIETRPLILVEAKASVSDQTLCSILLQNAETVALVAPSQENGSHGTAIPVTSLKVGDQIVLRKLGEARHTGIEIQEFIVEK